MLSFLISTLLFFWFLRNLKQILFWIYLWQLKQYHRGRFLDHFKTEKGKKIIHQPFNSLKLLLLALFFIALFLLPANFLLFFPFILLLVYFAESFFYFRAIFNKKTRNPVLTIKTLFLIIINLLVMVAYPLLVWELSKNNFVLVFALLIFDILLPLIISGIVIVLQPLADAHRLWLQARAKRKINKLNKNLTIIAITGSYAKTSTKEYLATILETKFKVLNTKEHRNTEVGIPFTILKELNSKHEIFIAEMGAYDKGTIKRICDFLQPDIGVVTGVNAQHLALFGSMDNLLSAEGGRELLDSLPDDGMLLANGDNGYCFELYKKAEIRKLLYSLDSRSDAQVKNIDVQKDFISFSVKTKDNDAADFKVNAYGKHNILNLLAAILIAKELGMGLEEIAKACKKIEHRQAFFKVIKGKHDFDVIDATYSANPDGVIADLEYLKTYSGKKVVVMPCLIELGAAAKETHQAIGKKIAEVCDLAIITTKDCFNDIKEAAVKNNMLDNYIINMSDTNLIVGKIKSFCRKGDVVLLEGRIGGDIVDKLTR